MKPRPPQTRPEPLLDKLRRHRGAAIVIAVPILVVSFLLFFVAPPRAVPIAGVLSAGRKAVPGGDRGSFRYVVVFDAGSSGSRVHVYCFDGGMELVGIGGEIELFRQLKPGLSSYAKNPQEAAKSLIPLLKEAESVVPAELRSTTPVRVGATAGLRALGAETSEQILQAVKDLLENQSSLKVLPNSVTVLDGTQEGAYQWVTINYLLGKLGKSYSNTVGVVDLGGGSVQMAYAISEEDAANAPKVSDGEDSYVQKLFLKGINYNLYVHSYLHYGLLAARAEILKITNDKSDCILKGYHDLYKYGGMEYNAFAPAFGASFSKCQSDVNRALKRDQQTCTHIKCTFNDVWSGGGGDGQKNLFVASFFFDRAAEAGFINPNLPVAQVKPAYFKAAAKAACSLDLESAKAKYSNVQEDNLPYLCMDLVYQYTLLVDGFGLLPDQKVTLVKKVQYRESFVEAAWPLGSAIEVASSL